MNPLAQALLLLFPSMEPWVTQHPEIPAAIVQAAGTHAVPGHVLMAVCFMESRLGADRRTPYTCGVIRVARERQADAAAHALARWRARCGSWRGALTMFRTSECRSSDPTHYARRVLSLASNLLRASERVRSNRGASHASSR